MKRASSLRLTGPYAPFTGDAPCSSGDAPCSSGMLRGPPDGPDDVLVAGAAADLPGQRLPDLGRRRVRVAVEQPAGGQHHARRAEPALQPLALGEAALHQIG